MLFWHKLPMSDSKKLNRMVVCHRTLVAKKVFSSLLDLQWKGASSPESMSDFD